MRRSLTSRAGTVAVLPVLAVSTVLALSVGAATAAGPEASPPTSRGASRAATTPLKVLFDDTKAETAGNADWIISTSMPDPTAQNPAPTRESDWTGALSAWGVALQRTGNYQLATLPPSGSITYGNSGNAQDLSHYNAFVLPEPNVLFTAAEKTAIMTFVHNGGGLFMISDHNNSDRNNDGADSVEGPQRPDDEQQRGLHRPVRVLHRPQ